MPHFVCPLSSGERVHTTDDEHRALWTISLGEAGYSWLCKLEVTKVTEFFHSCLFLHSQPMLPGSLLSGCDHLSEDPQQGFQALLTSAPDMG